ncbi:MAG: hypothetical protein GF421_00720 [Candidatus Aminicenantes bacterium]|nr:hypothetical protein [Candidatus Aminicenantes bacterium]
MKAKRKWAMLCGILPLIILMSGCFCVEVKQNVNNPGKYFRQAVRKINDLHRIYPDRRGPVSTIHVLVYDRSELELVRVIAPMWLIDAGMDYCDTYDIETDIDFDFNEIRSFKDIGPGMLVEVDGEDSRILVWLE